MNRILKFLKTPLGQIVCIAAFVAIGAFVIHAANTREKPPAITTAPATAPEPMQRQTIVREATPLRIPPKLPPQNSPKPDASEPTLSRPHAARGDQPPQNTATKKLIVLPISLLPATSAIPQSEIRNPQSPYAPYGRLIPCETIITLESSKLDTPIIGLVTEDVWHDGRLIIPAGAEVHGRAATDRARDRIAASGQWIIVWRDATTDNGNELTLTGIALDRERDDLTGAYGPRDGSAGLAGHIIKTDDLQEIKLFASTFLAGAASGLQDMQTTGALAGTTGAIAVPKSTAKNAALAGTADVLNAYAAQIQKQIQEEGFYVCVPAGKQFYLYVTQTLDKSKATRALPPNDTVHLWQKPDPK